MCERELETEQNCYIFILTLLAVTAFLSRSPGLLNRGPGFLYCILSPIGLVSKLTDFLSSLSYIIVPRPPSSDGRHNFAFIQPVHGQDYNILIIPRPDAPVIYICAFPILTARPGRSSIYSSMTRPGIERQSHGLLADTIIMSCFHWLFTKGQMSIRTAEIWPYYFFFFASVEARA